MYIDNLKSIDTEGAEEGVVVLAGYANRYLAEDGSLVVDRSEESVPPMGIRLENYKKNPVILYQHISTEPIGKARMIEARPDGLYVEFEVHKAMHEKAYYGAKAGILKALSIGFRIFDYKEVEGVWFWTDTELFEISLVSVPDNQDSLTTVIAKSAKCEDGKCFLATKMQTEPSEWRKVNKKEMKEVVMKEASEEIVAEIYLVADGEPKFPHHIYKDGKVEFNEEGFVSAINALKSAMTNDSLTDEQILNALKHAKAHLDSDEVSDKVKTKYNEFISEKLNEFEEKLKHTDDDSTINKQEPEDGGNGAGNANDETPASSINIEDVEKLITSLSESEEGINQLFSLYSSIEQTINSALAGITTEGE